VELGTGDLLNINFGVGLKTGPAGTGRDATDFWNTMGEAYNRDYTVHELRRFDGVPTLVSARLQNSGGIWGNRSGDPMYDSYVYPNSDLGDGVGNILLTLTGLPVGRYDLVLYGHGDFITPDNRPEANSVFSVRIGSRQYGPAGTLASPLWTVDQGWQEGRQYVVLRGLELLVPGEPVLVTVQPGYNGVAGTLGWWDRVAILNGLQLVAREVVVDADQDGVPDSRDRCPNTPLGEVVNAEGCSVWQLCPCEGPWRNHGDYVGSVMATAGQFYRAGLLTLEQRVAIIREAARSACGRVPAAVP
jgi:hypothetical protein